MDRMEPASCAEYVRGYPMLDNVLSPSDHERVLSAEMETCRAAEPALARGDESWAVSRAGAWLPRNRGGMHHHVHSCRYPTAQISCSARSLRDSPTISPVVHDATAGEACRGIPKGGVMTAVSVADQTFDRVLAQESGLRDRRSHFDGPVRSPERPAGMSV